MNKLSHLSRRDLLKMLSIAPLLPLSAGFAASALAAGSGVVADIGKFTGVTFSSIPAPDLSHPAAMATTTAGSVMSVHFEGGSSVDYKLSFSPFFITGDLVPDGKGGKALAGAYYDINNEPIMDKTIPGRERQFFSDSPDGTSLLTVPGAKVEGVMGNTVFAVVQFEYTTAAQDGKTSMYGKLPSPIAVLTLDQNPRTGKLSLVQYHNVDTSSVNGLWVTCGASLSPWATHLSSEEYEPDAFASRDKNFMNAFSHHLYGDATRANPYHYGHLPEVTVRPDGTGSIKKHYCLGRISHELVQVMPDNRTVMMGDDATNSAYFVFVADEEKDLSAGTLYVAKVGAGFSIDPEATAAPLTWIRLGAASSDEIRSMVDAGIKPTDIFDLRNTDPADASFTKIVANGKTEWIRLVPGREKAAAFLETHRYAACVGASLGFTKMEGTTVNIKDKVAYSALQNMQSAMVTGHAANVPGNGIALPKQRLAGGVMQLNLRGGVIDHKGVTINSEWMPVDIKALLVGEDIDPDALGNTANPHQIANPDNLKFSEKMRTLFIGEDSSQHINNYLWAYHVDTKKLARIMSIPAGAESTGLHAVDELNGWTYIMSNFQHPGDWLPIHSKVKPILDPLINAHYKNKSGAAVGYLTGELSAMTLAKR